MYTQLQNFLKGIVNGLGLKANLPIFLEKKNGRFFIEMFESHAEGETLGEALKNLGEKLIQTEKQD